MAATTQPTTRLYQLQSLRFVAAALVLIGHVLMEARQHGAIIPDWLYDFPWGSGVDIFFVISGFIILFIAKNDPSSGRAAADFLIKRAIRIVPLYWLFTFAMLAVIMVTPGRVRALPPDAADLLRSLFFIPYTPSGYAGMRPILAQGWTLNFEFFFYCVFGAAIFVFRDRFRAVALALLLTIIGGFVLALPPAWAYLFSPLLVYFILGMAMAQYREELPTISTPMVALLCVIAIAWAAMAPAAETDVSLRIFSRGLPSLLIVFAIVQWRSPPAWTTRGALPLLGDASYALYLSHPFAFNAVVLAFSMVGLAVGSFAMIVGGVLAVVLSIAVHLWIERPVLHTLTGWYRKTRLSRPAPTDMDHSQPLSSDANRKPVASESA